MKYTVTKSLLRVVGNIWQPGIGLCAMEYNLDDYDVGCMRETDGDTLPVTEGPITRESVQRWIDTHCGDFSNVVDWWASIENNGETIEFHWQDEQHEVDYYDCVYGSEDD